MGSTRCSVQRADRECNLIQINKMDWVYVLGLAASPKQQIAEPRSSRCDEDLLEDFDSSDEGNKF